MATISIARLPQQLSTSTAIRQFLIALGFAWLAIVFGCLLYAIETFLIQPQSRFIENPPAVMMRACGLAHFWIGWLFLFSSPKLRNPSSLSRLLILTFLGILLCLVCQAVGSLRNPLIFIFFYSYFLIHDLRDQTDLYLGSKQGRQANRLVVDQLQRIMITLVIALLAFSYLGYLFLKKPTQLGNIPPQWVLPGIAILTVCFLVSPCLKLYRGAQEHFGSLSGALATHSPIVGVYLLILAVLVLATPLGGLSLNLIILIHAGIWLVHVYNQLKAKKSTSHFNPWTWVRSTPTGFLCLHIALILIILLLMALRVHCWERGGWISELLEGSNFPYWSLMHISMAFWRSR